MNRAQAATTAFLVMMPLLAFGDTALHLPDELAGYAEWRAIYSEPLMVSPASGLECNFVVGPALSPSDHGLDDPYEVQVYASAAALRPQKGKPDAYPVGSIVAKEKRRVVDGRLSIIGVAFMVKRDSGFEVSNGWEFLYYPDRGKTAVAQRRCASCHASAPRDHVFADIPLVEAAVAPEASPASTATPSIDGEWGWTEPLSAVHRSGILTFRGEAYDHAWLSCWWGGQERGRFTIDGRTVSLAAATVELAFGQGTAEMERLPLQLSYATLGAWELLVGEPDRAKICARSKEKLVRPDDVLNMPGTRVLRRKRPAAASSGFPLQDLCVDPPPLSGVDERE